MAHAVNWFAIQGPNGKALQTFYSKLFDWKLGDLPGGGDMRMVPKAEGGITGGIGTSQDKKASVSVYVSVGDIDQYLAKAEKGGGHIAMPKMELDGGMGSIAGFTDPAGNWIGLWEAAKKAPKKTAAKKKAAGGAVKKAAGAKKKVAKKKAGAKKK